MYYRIHQNNNSKVGKQGKFYARAVAFRVPPSLGSSPHRGAPPVSKKIF